MWIRTSTLSLLLAAASLAQEGAPAAAPRPAPGPGARVRQLVPSERAPAPVTPPAAEGQAVQHTLAQVRQIFGAADADHDGSIERGEAARYGVTERAFRAFDRDSDAAVSADEFLVGYREHVVAAGHQIAPELATETDRIVAARRAQAAGAGEVTTRPAAVQGPGARRASEANSAPDLIPGSPRSVFQRVGPDATPERVRNKLWGTDQAGPAVRPEPTRGPSAERLRLAREAEQVAKARAAERLRRAQSEANRRSGALPARPTQMPSPRRPEANAPAEGRRLAPGAPSRGTAGSKGDRPAPAPESRAGRSSAPPSAGGRSSSAGVPAPRAGAARPKSSGRSSRNR